MQDEFHGQFWADNHRLFSNQIADFIDKLAYAFRHRALRHPAPPHFDPCG